MRSAVGGSKLGGPCRSGLTFLEIVLAVAILGLLAATMTGAFGFAYQAQARQRQILAANEMAGSIMMQYLDDQYSMPSSLAPLEYAGARFRWSLNEDPVTVRGNDNQEIVSDRAGIGGGGGRSTTPTRIQLITVRAWLSEESGGSFNYNTDVPHATVARMVDPMSFLSRNPDSAERLKADHMKEFIDKILGGAPVAGPSRAEPSSVDKSSDSPSKKR